MTGAPAAPAGPRPSVPHWLLNPYLLILLGALLDSVGEVLLKKGAAVPAGFLPAFLSPLASGWTWLGIISYVCSMVSWLYVLRTVPLSIAFPLINVVHVFVPVGAYLFLHEPVPPKFWTGILLIVAGAAIIARPVMRAEEKL